MPDSTSTPAPSENGRPRRRRSRRSDPPRLTIEDIERDFGHLPPILSLEALAEVLGRSKYTLYHWSSQGLLEGTYRKRGGCLYFLRTKVLLHVFNEREWGDARKAA